MKQYKIVDTNLHNNQQGFTFVELMMVLMVIGILTSIALPTYSNYTAKASHVAGLQEIAPGKMQIEINLNEGLGNFTDPQDIGLASSGNNCSSIEVTASSVSGEATLSCTLKGNSTIAGAVITLKRASDGFWSCESTAKEEFVGESCISVGG